MAYNHYHHQHHYRYNAASEEDGPGGGGGGSGANRSTKNRQFRTFRMGPFDPENLTYNGPQSLYLLAAKFIVNNVNVVRFNCKVPAEVCDNLIEIFRLVGNKSMCALFLAQIDSHRCRVTNANLSDLELTNDELFNFVDSHSKTLKSLNIDNCNRLTADTLGQIVKKLIQVKDPRRLHRQVTVYEIELEKYNQMRGLSARSVAGLPGSNNDSDNEIQQSSSSSNFNAEPGSGALSSGGAIIFDQQDLDLSGQEFVWRKVYHNQTIMTVVNRSFIARESSENSSNSSNCNSPQHIARRDYDFEIDDDQDEDEDEDQLDLRMETNITQTKSQSYETDRNRLSSSGLSPEKYRITYKRTSKPLLTDFDLHQEMGLFHDLEFVTQYFHRQPLSFTTACCDLATVPSQHPSHHPHHHHPHLHPHYPHSFYFPFHHPHPYSSSSSSSQSQPYLIKPHHPDSMHCGHGQHHLAGNHRNFNHHPHQFDLLQNSEQFQEIISLCNNASNNPHLANLSRSNQATSSSGATAGGTSSKSSMNVRQDYNMATNLAPKRRYFNSSGSRNSDDDDDDDDEEMMIDHDHRIAHAHHDDEDEIVDDIEDDDIADDVDHLISELQHNSTGTGAAGSAGLHGDDSHHRGSSTRGHLSSSASCNTGRHRRTTIPGSRYLINFDDDDDDDDSHRVGRDMDSGDVVEQNRPGFDMNRHRLGRLSRHHSHHSHHHHLPHQPSSQLLPPPPSMSALSHVVSQSGSNGASGSGESGAGSGSGTGHPTIQQQTTGAATSSSCPSLAGSAFLISRNSTSSPSSTTSSSSTSSSSNANPNNSNNPEPSHDLSRCQSNINRTASQSSPGQNPLSSTSGVDNVSPPLFPHHFQSQHRSSSAHHPNLQKQPKSSQSSLQSPPPSPPFFSHFDQLVSSNQLTTATESLLSNYRFKFFPYEIYQFNNSGGGGSTSQHINQPKSGATSVTNTGTTPVSSSVRIIEIRTWESSPIESLILGRSSMPDTSNLIMEPLLSQTKQNSDLLFHPQLTSLKRLVINDWPVDIVTSLMPKTLEESVAARLQHLEFISCKAAIKLDSLIQLKQLRTLVLHNCSQIPQQLDNICQLKSLRVLDISNFTDEDEDHEYDDPTNNLKRIVESLPDLVSLDISGTNLAGFQSDTIGGLESRQSNPFEFLGLLQTTNEACYRQNIPAVKIAGDTFENFILTACEAYIDRVVMLRRGLNELFQLFRYESGQHDLERSLKIIVCALGRHPSDKLVQVAASATLFYIVKSDEAKPLLGRCTKQLIVSRLLDAMQTFRYDQTMLRNGCLNLIHFRIPADVISEYTRLADILLFIVTNDEEDFVQRLGIYLLNSLACQVDGDQKTIVGNLGAIEKMLQLIEIRFNRNICDEVMETAWSTMWNVTDETPINCERFLNNNGMDFFVNCMERFCEYPELLRNMMGLLGNVSECAHLRYRLMNQEYISRFIRLLDSQSDGIEVSYNSAGILAHIASDGPVVWDRYLDSNCSRDEMLHQMEVAISRWEINSKRNINYRSFEPILRLLRVLTISWQAQYWAVWALANLTRVHSSKYCHLLRKDGGIKVLQAFVAAPRPDNFKLPTSAKCLAAITLLQYYLFRTYGNLKGLEKSDKILMSFQIINPPIVFDFLRKYQIEHLVEEFGILPLWNFWTFRRQCLKLPQPSTLKQLVDSDELRENQLDHSREEEEDGHEEDLKKDNVEIDEEVVEEEDGEEANMNQIVERQESQQQQQEQQQQRRQDDLNDNDDAMML